MNPIVIGGILWIILKPKKEGKPVPTGASNSASKAWKDVMRQRRFAGMTSLGVVAKRYIKGTSIPSEHWCGNAIDFAGTADQMIRLQAYLEKNAVRLKVNYVIHNKQVSKQGGVRKVYTGADPHTSHVHVDFFPKCVI